MNSGFGPRRGARILVVDDNDDDIELLRIAFDRHPQGCSMTAVSSVTEARKVLDEPTKRPDIVLLDWKMPGMSGPEFVRAIRRDPRLVGLPLLVFSSSDAPADVRQAHEAGATAYLVKPPGLREYEEFVRDLNGFWCRPVLYPP
ncbi:MAG: response regulator [Myxococcota bacterium]